MNEKQRLNAVGTTTNILIKGSDRQVELFLFYLDLGVKALKEMAKKEENFKQELLKANAVKKGQEKEKKAVKENPAPKKKHQQEKSKSKVKPS